MKTILDVSNIVYGGHYGSPDWRISGFPVGGIRKLLGILNAGIRGSDFILCFDGGNTIKKELLPSYKAGRVPNYSVLAQLDLLKEILLDCDIPFYQDEKYEADDYICSLVHFFDRVRDPDNITIYSDDRDLACCVSDTVTLRNATSNGIIIDRNNYEQRVVSGKSIPYNTILLYKLFYGDKSDNYSGVSIPGLRFHTFAQEFIDAVTPFIERGDIPETGVMFYDAVCCIIDGLSDAISEESKKILKDQARIVFPQIFDVTENGFEAFCSEANSTGKPVYQVEQNHLKLVVNGGYNKSKFDSYCTMFSLNKCNPFKGGMDMTAFKDRLHLLAKDLSNGVMAVERYNQHKFERTTTQMVADMELPL